MGGPNAIGSTVNIPLPPNTSEEGFLYTAENVVMPILEAFQPQLVINSAGQDNHYSDPITNMNFSAQGYAELTSLIKPDIAVLEGGYSIEGALPYVNTGIVLAMAGIDYSHVREPGYDADKIRQSPDTTEMIQRIGDKVLDFWQSRESIQAKLQADKKFEERKRSIFYDTDNIQEVQKDFIRICNDCSGALKIDSNSSKGYKIVGIHIPPKACGACKNQGYAWYEAENPQSYDGVFLQDRTEDTYLVKES
jgi:hypothetical protein